MGLSINRSPLFYVGDKYKLMEQLLSLFPSKVNNFYEPFVGGGTVFLNVNAKQYFLNEIDEHLVNIHQFLISQAQQKENFFSKVENIIKRYQLSCSYKEDIVPQYLKEKHKKTYYAKFNKLGYNELRLQVNKEDKFSPLFLYVLLIYGFNRMLRFNSGGKFNLPVGNVDFNRNVVNALHSYFDYVVHKQISLTAYDFRIFLDDKEFKKNDFVYFDPPYLITSSEYNKKWDVSSEQALYNLIDNLDSKGVKFALSNVTHYKGIKNNILIKWMKKYKVNKIKSNYINYHNNGLKDVRELLITNY